MTKAKRTRAKKAHKARLSPAMLLCAVGQRAVNSKDFEYVEILDAKGPLLAAEMKRLIKAQAPYLGIDDFADRQEMIAAMPKRYRQTFLSPGLWVLGGIPKAVEHDEHKGNESVPRVCFNDKEKLTWRRPRESDQWPKRLHCAGSL